MNQCILSLGFIVFVIACSHSSREISKPSITKGISILEIYLEDSSKVRHLSNFLRDTLKLPVEWEPFDIFGNGVVYDAAYHLGNTTLELLSINPPIELIKEEAKFNRILFHSENIDSTSKAVTAAGIEHQPPFAFDILSNNSEITIGKQINLDSISTRSNVHIAFWQFLNPGYNFPDRAFKGKTMHELQTKLNMEMRSNPMGITGLKEVHLSIDQQALTDWRMLFGMDTANKWILSDGPVISYTVSNAHTGVAWITLGVEDLDRAKEFLTHRSLLSGENGKVAIAPSKVYGLQIYIDTKNAMPTRHINH